jgi:hypothetical protein
MRIWDARGARVAPDLVQLEVVRGQLIGGQLVGREVVQVERGHGISGG